MPFSEASKPHIRHIRDLEDLLLSSPTREYSAGNEPEGYLEYWRPHFAGLYLVSIYIYISEVAGSEKFWNTSAAFSTYPELVRCLEVMRLVRNRIVHHAGISAPLNTPNGKEIRDFETDVANSDVELTWLGKTVEVRPFYSLGPNGEIKMLPNGLSMIRFLAVAALETEGIVAVVP